MPVATCSSAPGAHCRVACWWTVLPCCCPGAAGTAPSVSYCMNGFIAISRVASRGSGALRSFGLMIVCWPVVCTKFLNLLRCCIKPDAHASVELNAGIWTGAFFIVFGIFAKLSAFFVSIPDCLNGGLLIIIAAIVMGPGVRVRAQPPS